MQIHVKTVETRKRAKRRNRKVANDIPQARRVVTAVIQAIQVALIRQVVATHHHHQVQFLINIHYRIHNSCGAVQTEQCYAHHTHTHTYMRTCEDTGATPSLSILSTKTWNFYEGQQFSTIFNVI